MQQTTQRDRNGERHLAVGHPFRSPMALASARPVNELVATVTLRGPSRVTPAVLAQLQRSVGNTATARAIAVSCAPTQRSPTSAGPGTGTGQPSPRATAHVQRQGRERRRVGIRELQGERPKTVQETIDSLLNETARKNPDVAFRRMRVLLVRGSLVRTPRSTIRVKVPADIEDSYARYHRCEITNPTKLREDIRKAFTSSPPRAEALLKLLPARPRKASLEEVLRRKWAERRKLAAGEIPPTEKLRLQKQFKGNLFAQWLLDNWVALRTDERVKRMGIFVGSPQEEGGFEYVYVSVRSQVDNRWNVLRNATCVTDPQLRVDKSCCREMTRWRELFTTIAPRGTMASNMRSQVAGMTSDKRYWSCRERSQ